MEPRRRFDVVVKFVQLQATWHGADTIDVAAGPQADQDALSAQVCRRVVPHVRLGAPPLTRRGVTGRCQQPTDMACRAALPAPPACAPPA
jgi:hypothetical protein